MKEKRRKKIFIKIFKVNFIVDAMVKSLIRGIIIRNVNDSTNGYTDKVRYEVALLL